MSTLDEITKEKQRVGEALARVDAQVDFVFSGVIIDRGEPRE